MHFCFLPKRGEAELKEQNLKFSVQRPLLKKSESILKRPNRSHCSFCTERQEHKSEFPTLRLGHFPIKKTGIRNTASVMIIRLESSGSWWLVWLRPSCPRVPGTPLKLGEGQPFYSLLQL